MLLVGNVGVVVPSRVHILTFFFLLYTTISTSDKSTVTTRISNEVVGLFVLVSVLAVVVVVVALYANTSDKRISD